MAYKVLLILLLLLLQSCRIPQGRLFDYICSRQHFDELMAAEYVRQILDAVHYLHNCRIAHLDLKVGTAFMIFCLFVLMVLLTKSVNRRLWRIEQ